MARKEKRINISLSDEMLERLDHYSALFGIPRASMCTMLIGQGIFAWDKSLSLSEEMTQQVNSRLAEEIQKRLLTKVQGGGNGEA